MLVPAALVLALSVLVQSDYMSDRRKFIDNERTMMVGSSIKLNNRERLVNDILMKAKLRELEDGYKNPGSFPPANHFFRVKKAIEKSEVFSIIKRMPKGAVLHSHDSAVLPPEWIIRNVTYREHLWACNAAGKWKFAFAYPKPSEACWQLVSEMRAAAHSNEEFDAWLKSLLSLEVENPEAAYPDINEVWKKFQGIFGVVGPMITYKPVFEDYFYAMLQFFYDDNIMYVEARSSVRALHDLVGWPTKPIQVLDIMQGVVDRFVKNNPEFVGAKIIFSKGRHVDEETVDEYLQIYRQMEKLHPDFMAGFDLVGQEDLGYPLVKFIELLREYRADVNYFFHAGETAWSGTSTDDNLVDAVLLNTTRIGHGYAMIKHPKVMDEVKRRGIAIEVNPISNQVLMLVKDMRNHPASVLLAEGYPVVISSDDSGFWGSQGLSHDFYMAFMGMASADADLKMLKQLSINSITYSTLNAADKHRAMSLFDKVWNRFIENIIAQNS